MATLPLHLPPSLPRLLSARTSARLTVCHVPSQCAPPLAGFQRASYAKRSADGVITRTLAPESRSKRDGSYARQPVKNGRRVELGLQQREKGQLVTTFLQACNKRDIQTMLELYPGLVATRALGRNDIRRVAQALHQWIRTSGDARGGASLNDALMFADRLVSDIQTGAVLPEVSAHIHLLGLYKESKSYRQGYAFWKWLVDRGPDHVNADVYGAALELMAYGKILPLSDLETIYANALKRFPGVFAAYHLSPDAIVPDRARPINIPELPVYLLQGILTARVVYGDWRNAYLALDTALRLFPVQLPARFFELFMVERPCPEAYMAFLLGCRAGVLFKSNHLTNLLKKLRDHMKAKKISLLGPMGNAIYAYLETGGSLHPIHVSSLIRAFAVVDRIVTSGQSNTEDATKSRSALVTAAHEVTTAWIQAGIAPTADIFTALIDVAGKCEVPDLFQVCLQDLVTARLEPSRSHMRIIIATAASLGNKEVVESYWSRMASGAEAEGKQLELTDWLVLSKACTDCGHRDYFNAQLIKYDHMLDSSSKEALAFNPLPAKQQTSRSAGKDEPLKFQDIVLDIDALMVHAKNISAVVMSGNPLDLHRTPFHMSLDPVKPPLGLSYELRAIYDELTTDPRQPAPLVKPEDVAIQNPLGHTLDELRFQNWVSVLEMMNHAKLSSSLKEMSMEQFNRHLPLRGEGLRRFIRQLRGTKFQGSLSHRPLTEPVITLDEVAKVSNNFNVRKLIDPSPASGNISDKKSPAVIDTESKF